MNDQTASAVRTLLKLGGAALVTHGKMDEQTVEALIGVVVTLIGIIWSYTAHKTPKATS